MAERWTALYSRVSTDAQYEEGYSVEAQRAMLEGWCAAHQVTHFQHYIDGGYSGSHIDRPAAQRLISDVCADRVCTVVVYKLDRLSRSQKDTLYLIEDVFLPHQVDFVSLNENLDTGTPYGRAMIGILSAFAQLERETIRERTRMGMLERVKNGYWPGGGRTPMGYDYDASQGILVPNAEAETVREIYRRYVAGESCGSIARELGLGSEQLVLQVLLRQSNTGVIPFRGQVYPGRHQPIVSKALYETAMALYERRKNHRRTTSRHLLAGMVTCGVCGARMRYVRWGKQGYKLWCYAQDRHKPHLNRGIVCDNERIDSTLVENAVLRALFVAVYRPPEPDEQPVVEDRRAFERRRRTAERRLARLYDLYARNEGEDAVLLSEIEQAREALEQLARQAKVYEQAGDRLSQLRETRQRIRSLAQVWDQLDMTARRAILARCIEEIRVTHGEVCITLNSEHFTVDEKPNSPLEKS